MKLPRIFGGVGVLLSAFAVGAAAQLGGVTLPGQDTDEPDHTVVIVGAGGEARYRVVASDRIEAAEGRFGEHVASFNADDEINGATATGSVAGGVDAYSVYGSIETLEWVSGQPGDFIVDGAVIDPDVSLVDTANDLERAVRDQVGETIPSLPQADGREHLVIAGDRSGAEARWAVARGSKNWAGGVPDAMVDALVRMTDDGTGVDVIAFAPNGGWAVVAGDQRASIGPSQAYKDTLQTLQTSGREIMAVAFNPVNWANMKGYVIVHDRGVEAAHVPDALVSELERFVDGGDDIYDVEITRNADWSFVTSSGDWTRGVSGGYFDALTNAREAGRTAEAIAFFGSERRWIIATDDRFHGAGVPEGLTSRLRGDFGLQGDVAEVRQSGENAPRADMIDGFTIASGIAPITDRAGAGQVDVRREVDLVDRSIRYLSWKERGDRPCILGVSSLSPSPDDLERRGEQEIWETGDCDYIGPGILGYNASGLNVRVPDDEVVTGLRVCTNHSRRNARVKGFELISWDAQSYYDAGENPAGSASGQAHAARPNCSDWHRATCPSGHVATGLELTVRQAGGLRLNGRWVNGVQLICRRLEPI